MAPTGIHRLPPHRQVDPWVWLAVAVPSGATAQFPADEGDQMWLNVWGARHGPPQPLLVQLQEAGAAEIPVHQPQPGGSWREIGDGRGYWLGWHFFPII